MTVKQLTFKVLIVLCIFVSSCGSGDRHGLSGNIKDAKADSYAVLEAINDFGYWYAIDSAKVNSNGDFFIPYEAPTSPQLYRVRYGNKVVYMPLDSTERLTLTASAANFDSDFKLTGSKLADNLTAFEHDARRIEALNNPDSTAAFRRQVYDRYMSDSHGDMLSYYILSRPFGGGFLIDYTDPIYSAVANSFLTYLPNDPHTAALVQRAKEGQAARRKARGQQSVVEAPEIAIIDMELPDSNGKKVKLSDTVGKGKPTVLVFTSAESRDNPALTRSLRSLYDSGSVDIYEVFFDTDRLMFANASKGLPWTVVQEPDGLNSQIILQYNIGTLPTIFIYNSRGELTQRASNTDELRQLLQITN